MTTEGKMQYSIISKLNAQRTRRASRLALLLCLMVLGLFGSHASAQSTEPDQAANAQQVNATLPNGRRISPVGDWITTAPFPFSLAIRPAGRQLTVPSLGFPFSL